MILITGGSGSGKSAYGEKRILEAGEMTRYYIATMEVFGEEGRKKVERHKKLRQGKGFITIESPKDVGREKVLEMQAVQTVMVRKKQFCWNVFPISQPMKCLAVPLETELEPDRRIEALAEKICTDIEKIDKAADFFAVITNEVGSDGEMYEKETLEYIRLLGLVNCRLAKMASEVVEVVYGIPVKCPH
ncbi:MAG: bifunctional adenosylcobinamide kinase/adenosylcobinamide-phosphate guanylyltransferase [Enterocloster sp.]